MTLKEAEAQAKRLAKKHQKTFCIVIMEDPIRDTRRYYTMSLDYVDTDEFEAFEGELIAEVFPSSGTYWHKSDDEYDSVDTTP